MKLRLGIFLGGLSITAIATSALVDILTRPPLVQRVYGLEGAGAAVGFILFGLGAGIGIPIILGRRKTKQ